MNSNLYAMVLIFVNFAVADSVWETPPFFDQTVSGRASHMEEVSFQASNIWEVSPFKQNDPVQGCHVDDAYVQKDEKTDLWRIGTSFIEMTVIFESGNLKISNFKNKLSTSTQDYIPDRSAEPIFVVYPKPSTAYEVQVLWSDSFTGGSFQKSQEQVLDAEVQKGDIIGFCVGSRGDYNCDEIYWITEITQDDIKYNSSDDQSLGQESDWMYYARVPGKGQMISLDAIEYEPHVRANVRLPALSSPHRMNGQIPYVGAESMHPSMLDVIRGWRALKSGKISINARVFQTRCNGEVDLSILRLRRHDLRSPSAESNWTLKSSYAEEVSYGGRPAVRLRILLEQKAIICSYNFVAFPGTSVLRQWVELVNNGKETLQFDLQSHHLFRLPFKAQGDTLHHYWLTGGRVSRDQGTLLDALITYPYRHQIASKMSYDFVPWMAFMDSAQPDKNGLMIALDYLGAWQFTTERTISDKAVCTITSPDVGMPLEIFSGETLTFPTVTLAIFRDDLDDMGKRLYDWQYEYLWSYTHDQWYGLSQWICPFWPDSHNLQENFAGRLANINISLPDKMRQAGIEVLWDDAGWSEITHFPEGRYDHLWHMTHQGPDFSHTVRYLEKCGMKWAIWNLGGHSGKLMDNKAGAWGNFQWRTDGITHKIGDFNLKSSNRWRDQMTGFVRRHPNCSLQFCNGGGTATHMFDIQNIAHNNQLTDGGRGDNTNFYFSYLDPPDKWTDIIVSAEAFWKGVAWDEEMSNSILTTIPSWYMLMPGEKNEQIAINELGRCTDLYRYLLREGVAGRWSYVFHPQVYGDQERYYFQRMNSDRQKGLIVFKQRPPENQTMKYTGGSKHFNRIRLHPKGLISDFLYLVEFESGRTAMQRTGADLMSNGIYMEDVKAGEIIYFNLPNRPGNTNDRVNPKPPGMVFARRESNIGHNGIGIYWSPAKDDVWVSGYEVRRNEKILGYIRVGTYFFDHDEDYGLPEHYSVRAVDGSGNKSEWISAKSLDDNPLEFSALGGHFGRSGRENWKAEMFLDGQYLPMKWISPAANPAADFGGTARQPGGVEGYWEGAASARIGRSWQQADKIAYAIRTWTAPKDGEVRVVGKAMKEYYRRNLGNPLKVKILHNNSHLWPTSDEWATVELGDLAGVIHDVSISIKTGDALRFVLCSSDDPENDVLAWTPRIIYTGRKTSDKKMDDVSVIRINCGAKEDFIDSSGNCWSADKYFNGGASFQSQSLITNILPSQQDQLLYQTARTGKNFTYTIPVKPGLYAIRFKFAELQHRWSFMRPFNLDINGKRELHNFDICWIARGALRGYDRVFRYRVPNANGEFVLTFTNGFDPLARGDFCALVQAIEILPERGEPLRFDVGANSDYVDWAGCVWESDIHSDGSLRLTSREVVDHASPTLHDQIIYQTAEVGNNLNYRIPIAPGIYTVQLKFADLWQKQKGRRLMRISINGNVFYDKWDPVDAVDHFGMAMDLRFEAITPDANGNISIELCSIGHEPAILQGIVIE